MENVEKVQEISPENTVETPEKVQQEAESSVKDQGENPVLEHPQTSENSEPQDVVVEELSPIDLEKVSDPSGNEVDTHAEVQEEVAEAINENANTVKVHEESKPKEEAESVTEKTEEIAKEDPPKLEAEEEVVEEPTTVVVEEEATEPEENKQPSEEVTEVDMTVEQPAEPKKEVVEGINEASASSMKEKDDAKPTEKEELVEASLKEEVAATELKEDEPEADENVKEAEKEGVPVAEEVSAKQEEEEILDFTNAPKEDLLKKIREVSKEERIPKIDRTLKALKPRFDELFEMARNAALKKFESDGNDLDSFEFYGDEIDKEFNALHSELRSKRNRYYRDLEGQKDENLKKKKQLLEQLRELTDGDESSSSINSVKEIQAEWKKTGPVPGSHNKTLWANYNALLDRFYDHRSIYFELKDLDRKKNLVIKEEICERAESLENHQDLKTAIFQLNELHEEYKHAGPVPRSDQESLWNRFKAASDTVYAKRKDYFDHLKVEFEANYEKKLAIANEVEAFVEFNSDSITDWNKKTKEIQALQKKWEEIGGLPRDKAKVINKQFWGSFKKFFAAKNQFFKRMESMRDDNLKRKEELILQAEELKESNDWNAATQKYKNLQAQWKEIGPVPEKVRNEVYKRFKTSCDHFFDRRRDENSEQEKGYEENLKLKLQICDQIEAIADQDEINLDDVYDLIGNHGQLGFVPRNAIKKDHARFEEATQKILTLEDLEESDREDLKHHIRRSRMRKPYGGSGGKSGGGGERKAQGKEHSVRRKISELESNISTWNTNMEFFASSEAADKLKADLQTKINEARGQLEDLKSQLSSIS